MGLDNRLPIGVFFSIVGLILTAFGLLGPSGIYARSLGMNVNVIWGVVLLIFGVAMITLALRAERISGRRTNRAGRNPGTVKGRLESR